MSFEIPTGARSILNALNAAGYEAYLVGGCVRDMLRGVAPHDWDICTSALPQETAACFAGHRVLETGLKHGTLTLLEEGGAYEVTTYRVDGAYTDGRRPDAVSFVSDLSLDLSRRDFTINAIAADVQGMVQDPFGGAADIRAGVVRCVGDPALRFQEDGLRIMRALRFASVLGYRIEEGTAAELHSHREMLRCVAAERISAELCRLLTGAGAADILRDYADVFCVFWPELGPMAGMAQNNPWHCWDVWEHTLRAVAATPADKVLRTAVLLHDIGKPRCYTEDERGVGHFYGHPSISAELAGDMLRRLKFDNDTRKQVVELVARHDTLLVPRDKVLRRCLNRLGRERFFQLLEVKRADCLGQNLDRVGQRLEELEDIRGRAERIIAERQCFSLKDLAVNGRDVIAAGAAPGPQVGKALGRLLEQVLDGALANERGALLDALSRDFNTEGNLL